MSGNLNHEKSNETQLNMRDGDETCSKRNENVLKEEEDKDDAYSEDEGFEQ